MNEGLCTLSVRDVSRIYNVSERAVHRWLNECEKPCPRYREGDKVTFALADLLPRIPKDPAPILTLDTQINPDYSASINLGSEVADRSEYLFAMLAKKERQKLSEVQNSYRESVAECFWEKVLFLESSRLGQALLLHPVVIRAVYGACGLPDEWERFCIDFTLKNSSPMALWHLAKPKTHLEVGIHV